MSVSDNYVVNVTQGNGATTIYTGSWSPLVASYMRVYLQLRSTGALGTALVQGAGAGQYTLTFTSAGYSITLGTAPSSLYNVVRAREVAITQATPYTTVKGFQGLVTENSFDKITAIAQDIRDDVDRGVAFQLGSTSTATMPEPEANLILGWNAAGDDLENKTAVDIGIAVVSPFVETLLDDLTAAAFLTTLGVTAAAQTVLDDATVAAMVDTLGGASSTGTGGIARATSPTFVTPLLGTPTSGTLTNCTGYTVANLSGAAAGVLTFLATPSSANLAAALTDETGTGANVFANTPTLVTPVLGVAAATSINFGQTALGYYGEGTWTPVDSSGAALSLTATGNYTRIGRMVFAYAAITYPVTADGTNALIGGLPFTVSNNNYARQGYVSYTDEATLSRILVQPNTTTFSLVTAAGANITNATMSTNTLYIMAEYPI